MCLLLEFKNMYSTQKSISLCYETAWCYEWYGNGVYVYCHFRNVENISENITIVGSFFWCLQEKKMNLYLQLFLFVKYWRGF